MPDKPIHGPTHRAYCGAMRRTAAITTALLVLGACSGGSDTEPLPLPTEAPTTTEAQPPTTTTTTTSTTTTTVLDSTTPTAPTTSIAPDPTTVPAPGTNSMAEVYAAAFEGYEKAWAARRAALRAPDDDEIRSTIIDLYIDNQNRQGVLDFIDSVGESGELSVEDPANPNSVEFLTGGVMTEDRTIAQILVCEVLNDDVVDATGQALVTDPYAYRVQTFMELENDVWKIQSESIDEVIPASAECL